MTEAAIILQGPGHAGLTGAPWVLTEDNADRIEVKDDRGEIVWLEDWVALPDYLSQKEREAIITSVRSRIHATITAVNLHADLLRVLAEARQYVAAADPRRTGCLGRIDHLLQRAMARGVQ